MYVFDVREEQPLPWKGVCIHAVLRNTCILIICNSIVVTGGRLIICVFTLPVTSLTSAQGCTGLRYTSITHLSG